MKRRLVLNATVLGGALLGTSCSAHDVPHGPEPAIATHASALESSGPLVIYDDALNPDWNDWSSWDATQDPDATSPAPYRGTRSMAVTFQGPHRVLELRPAAPIDTAPYDLVGFWVHGGSSGGQQVSLQVRDGAGALGAQVPITVTAGQWTRVEVSLGALMAPTAQLKAIRFLEKSGSGSPPTFYVDELTLAPASELVVYEDALAPSWSDAVSGTTLDKAATSPEHVDRGSFIAATFHAGGSSLTLQTTAPILASKFDTVSLWIHGGTAGGQPIRISLLAGAGALGAGVPIKPGPAGWWTRIDVAIRDLGDPDQITGIVLREAGGGAQPTFYLDQVSFVSGGCPAPPAPPAVGDELIVYGDTLVGWQDWSWKTTVDKASTSVVQSGTSAISVTYTEKWAGLFLHANSPIDGSQYDTVRFWIHGGSVDNQPISFGLRGVPRLGTDQLFEGPTKTLDTLVKAGEWKLVEFDLADLVDANMGNPPVITSLVWQESSTDEGLTTFPTFHVDRISFVRVDPPAPPVELALSVDAAANGRPISPDIYGINGSIRRDRNQTPGLDKDQTPNQDMAQILRLPVRRWGGNSTSRYNYTIDATNVGADWYFENIAKTDPIPSDPKESSAANDFIRQDRSTGARTLMSVPLLGWVARDTGSCTFDATLTDGGGSPVFGPQQEYDPSPSKSHCGNGVLLNGTPITTTEAQQQHAHQQIQPGFVEDWVRYLVSKFGTASEGGVALYNLDNEPMLWNDTHRDVFPEPLDYDGLRDRTYQYAAAIKAADPSAMTLGPVAWGWDEYFYSALDRVVSQECLDAGKTKWWDCTQDRKAHGDLPLAAWYLDQMRKYEQQHDVRILDYLDLHYYPESKGLARRPAGCPSIQAKRLRSTRSLWDPYYVDESWINEEPIQLIPRMRKWVDLYYPGTKLAITEYNFGALDHINGALAQADALGIFGREGLDLATLWWYADTNQPEFNLSHPAAFAFRMYRNYDSAGHGFGNFSTKAQSTDQGRLAVYAAHRTDDGALTIMVINKTGQQVTAPLALTNFTPGPNAKVFRYSEAHLGGIVPELDQPVTSGGFTATYPPNSITLFVVPVGWHARTLYSEPTVAHWADFFNGGSGDDPVNAGVSMPPGCEVLAASGVHYHQGVPQLPATQTVDHGNHGFTVNDDGGAPNDLGTSVHWWHDGLSSMIMRVAYTIKEPDGVDCSVPGATRDEP